VALQTAEASCRDGSSSFNATYVDCGNGTVTDNRTGLVWLANADCLGGGVDWYRAMTFVAGLSDHPGFSADDCGLSDGSSPGEWRLPSAAEWQTMVADAIGLGCSPTITGDFPAVTTPCWNAACNTLGLCAFSDVQSADYWSSTSFLVNPSAARFVDLGGGGGGALSKSFSSFFVWPVRGGQ